MEGSKLDLFNTNVGLFSQCIKYRFREKEVLAVVLITIYSYLTANLTRGGHETSSDVSCICHP